jgi:hypothetical protein
MLFFIVLFYVLFVCNVLYYCHRVSTQMQLTNISFGKIVPTLRPADHSSRGVLPTVMRRWVWSRKLINAESLAVGGLSRQERTNQTVPDISAKLSTKSYLPRDWGYSLFTKSSWTEFCNKLRYPKKWSI